MVMDELFGQENLLSEIIWKRTSAHSSAKRWGPNFDSILFYSKSEEYVWNTQYNPYDDSYLASHYRYVDPVSNERYRLSDLTGPGIRHSASGEAWRDYNPTDDGRHWKIPSYLYGKYKEVTGND